MRRMCGRDHQWRPHLRPRSGRRPTRGLRPRGRINRRRPSRPSLAPVHRRRGTSRRRPRRSRAQPGRRARRRRRTLRRPATCCRVAGRTCLPSVWSGRSEAAAPGQRDAGQAMHRAVRRTIRMHRPRRRTCLPPWSIPGCWRARWPARCRSTPPVPTRWAKRQRRSRVGRRPWRRRVRPIRLDGRRRRKAGRRTR